MRPLSPREFEVAERIARGRSLKEIAAELGIGTMTVGSYMGSICAKIDPPDGCPPRIAIAVWWGRFSVTSGTAA